jgi:4-amino-4-deoxy-L-arabinose transferase-like glycosyltransferase
VTSWLAPRDLAALAGFLLAHLAALFAFASLGFAIGATLARRVPFDSGLEKVVVATGLGLAIIGHALLGLGLLGLITREACAFALGASIVPCLSGWREWLRTMAAAARARPRPAIDVAAAILLAPLALLPLYPPTAFDATMYHLPYAQAFIASGGVPFLPTLRFPVFPQLAELLFAALMLWFDDVAAQCLQVLWTLLTAGVLYVWGRGAYSRPAGILAAALFLGGPIVVYHAGTAYVEPTLVFLTTAAVYAFGRWRRCGQTGWLAISAVFVASAAATKYLGLFFVILLGLAVLVTRAPAHRARSAALFLGLTAALLLLWYGRIAAYTGNPVFPYLPGLFGSSVWDLGEAQPGVRAAGDLLARLVGTIRLPWDLVFAREKFGWHPPFSPFYLLAAPLALLAAVRDVRARRLLLVSAAYALFVSVAPPDPRYLLPGAALLAVPAAAGAAALSSRRFGEGRRPLVLGAAVVLLLAPGWLYGLRHAWHRGPVPVSAAAREAHFSRLLPAYAAIARLNRDRADRYSLYAFGAENMRYFAEGRFWGSWFGPGSHARVLAAAGSAEGLHRTLRALGVTHLLLLDTAPFRGALSDPRFADYFEPAYADGRARVFALTASAARASRTTSGPP